MAGKGINEKDEKRKNEELFRRMLELYTMLPPFPWKRKKRIATQKTK
ncbi:MAG TPA: hypothetical protein VHO50_14245 [Bacteroidales bacterium]|nr:hypothetical protein [Bacteroidales bacterium]